MTPLGASLAFIVISILISTIKHFIFPSSSSTSDDESQIQLKKLYTITDKKPERQNKSYASFYQAYHKYHMSEIQEKRYKIQENNFLYQYNSLVMKKSTINNQQTIICEQNFIITIAEGVNCNNNSQYQKQQCQWQTSFGIYELPLLREQTKRVINLKGRISSNQKALRNNLRCKKIKSTDSYLITFALLNKNTQSSNWSLNSIEIIKNKNYVDPSRKMQTTFKQKASLKQKKQKSSDKDKDNKNKKLEAKRYQTPKVENIIKKSSNKSFQFQIFQYKLKQTEHVPSIYHSDGSCLIYCTQNQPWLIRYNCGKKWGQINILHKQIQSKIYQDLVFESRIPPFERASRVKINYLFSFQITEETYSDDCLTEQRDACNQKVRKSDKNYITVVFEHENSNYRVERFIIQLTFEINKRNQLQTSDNVQNCDTNEQSISKLISYSMLLSQINPTRKINSDCILSNRKQRIYQRHFDKYYWLYENKLIATVDVNSLLCVFTFNIDQHLKIIEIKNIIHSNQTNKREELMYLDWKTLTKLINYRQGFQTQIRQRHNELKNNIIQLQYTRNKTQFNHNNSALTSNHQNQNQNQNEHKNENNHTKIAKQMKEKQQEQKNKEKDKDLKRNQNKKIKNKKQKKSKLQNQSSKKKKKNKGSEFQKKQFIDMTPIQGQCKPNIQTSFNYSIFRQRVFPHQSHVERYKFPLPFLFSFTKNMQIINTDTSKPLILFDGIKQFLFTYKHKDDLKNKTGNNKIVDYRYLTLGQNNYFSKKLYSTEGQPQKQIQNVKDVVNSIKDKGAKQKINIQIKDQTHPEVQNVLKSMLLSDEQILNQIKSIKSVPVSSSKRILNSEQLGSMQVYQNHLIVVWGWGIQVYQIDWDKNKVQSKNATGQEIQEKLSQTQGTLMVYFLPFVELFATFYCMFQALISSR